MNEVWIIPSIVALAIAGWVVGSIQTIRIRHIKREVSQNYIAKAADALRLHESEMVEMRSLVQRLTTEDLLTGLTTRRQILSQIEREFIRSHRYGNSLSILLVDLDSFHRVNEVWGFSTGDRILRVCADSMRLVLRESDQIGRFGGEEFIVMLPETHAQNAMYAAEKIRAGIANLDIDPAVKTASELGGGHEPDRVHLTCSIGVASIRSEHKDLYYLIQEADTALSRAKSAGRNRIGLSMRS